MSLGAYDFYSFLKLRVTFHGYVLEGRKQEELHPADEELIGKDGWSPEEAKQKIEETYTLLEQAKDEKYKGRYYESEKLLLKAKKSGSGCLEQNIWRQQLSIMNWQVSIVSKENTGKQKNYISGRWQ